MAARRSRPRVVTGMPSVQLSRAEFLRRFRERFADPSFREVGSQLDDVAEVAWRNYSESRKAPRTRRAGRGFADPDYELSLDWLAARASIRAAERAQRSRRAALRVLLINGSARSDRTCVGQFGAMLRDWLIDLDLIPAGPSPGVARYLGYYGAYASSHDDLDRDQALQAEVRNAAKGLVETVRQIRAGRYVRPDAGLEAPRKK